MRLLTLGIFLYLVLPAFPSDAAGGPPEFPQTRKEKESYSIGYQVGLSMKSDGIEVEFEQLVKGLRDALAANEPQLAPDDMKKLIADLRKRARETAMRRLQELTVGNAEESDTFLRENGRKEGVRTTESGLQYKVLKAGNGAVPKPEHSVRVHYRGTFIDGTEFDNSYAKGKPQTVRADGVIKGWTEALRLMRVGSKWRIFVPPHLAYGRNGLGQKIPPNKVLVFEIELLSVDDKEAKTHGE